MRTYATQMEAARKGIITPEMEAVAAKEYRTPEEIRDWVAKGQVVICANKLHTCIDPNGVGSMLRTKINVNLGHHGPVLPRQHPALPPEADPRVPRHDRHGAGV